MEKEQTFRKVIDENKDRIFRICSYYFQDEEDRADVFQESLIRIWESLNTFKGKSQVSTWVYRVTVNTCLTFIRKEKSRKKILEGVKVAELTDLPDKPSADEDPVSALKLVFFRNFLEDLQPIDKTIVSLYLEEISTREMAEITGLSEVNVRVRIHRLKERINIKWKEEQHGIR